MRVLQIIEQAFRTLTEEQDDTILWLTQSIASAGANVEVLLSGNCVYYGILKSKQPVLKIGQWLQKEPADIPQDIERLINQNIPIYVLAEDLKLRGIEPTLLHHSIKVLNHEKIVDVYNSVDQVWQW